MGAWWFIIRVGGAGTCAITAAPAPLSSFWVELLLSLLSWSTEGFDNNSGCDSLRRISAPFVRGEVSAVRLMANDRRGFARVVAAYANDREREHAVYSTLA